MAFNSEISVLNQALESLPKGLKFRLTGGFEDFLVEVLGINFCLGTSPYTTPPGTCFESNTTACIAFGATPIPTKEVLGGPRVTWGQARPQPDQRLCCFLRPDGVSKKNLCGILELFGNLLSIPDSACPLPPRIVILYDRKSCRYFNSWLDTWERRGRVFACGGWSSLRTRNMLTPTGNPWERLPGIWELVVLEGGQKESLMGLDDAAYCRAMVKLTGRSSPLNSSPPRANPNPTTDGAPREAALHTLSSRALPSQHPGRDTPNNCYPPSLDAQQMSPPENDWGGVSP